MKLTAIDSLTGEQLTWDPEDDAVQLLELMIDRGRSAAQIVVALGIASGAAVTLGPGDQGQHEAVGRMLLEQLQRHAEAGRLDAIAHKARAQAIARAKRRRDGPAC